MTVPKRSFNLTRVEPIGSHTGPAFVTRATGCTFEEIAIPTYPPSPEGEAFRKRRLALDLTMGDVARKLGLRVSEVSDIEHGRLVCSDWPALTAAMEA